MPSSKCSRESDERALDMIRYRVAGHPASRIGAHYGMQSEKVRTITDRIRRADEAESGEANVAAAYWPAASWRRT